MRHRLACLLAIVVVPGAVSGAGNDRVVPLGAGASPLPLASAHLHNLFRASTNIFSGDAPEGDAAFEEIAKLGVKTVISVDGTRPDVETARRHGLRYVHLPFGYAGIPASRLAELTKAAQGAEGLIYVHCHHGTHRGPAAVAVMCEATAGWTTNAAVAWLKQAGTSVEYEGLYRSAAEFRPPAASALNAVRDLPEIAKTSTLVETMVAIDGEFDQLKEARSAGWPANSGQSRRSPSEAATILWEHFKELIRVQEIAARPSDFRARLDAAANAAEVLKSLLRDSSSGAAARDGAFKTLGETCGSCHKKFRN